MITKTFIIIAKDERHDVYTSCFLHRLMYANVAFRYYMANSGFVGATSVSPLDLKFSFVSKQKPMFSRRSVFSNYFDVISSKKAYEYRACSGILSVSVVI